MVVVVVVCRFGLPKHVDTWQRVANQTISSDVQDFSRRAAITLSIMIIIIVIVIVIVTVIIIIKHIKLIPIIMTIITTITTTNYTYLARSVS